MYRLFSILYAILTIVAAILDREFTLIATMAILSTIYGLAADFDKKLSKQV